MRKYLSHAVFEIQDFGGYIELPDGSREKVRLMMLGRNFRSNGRFDYRHDSPRFFIVECRDGQFILPGPARDYSDNNSSRTARTVSGCPRPPVARIVSPIRRPIAAFFPPR
jgi:hypothetical protein